MPIRGSTGEKGFKGPRVKESKSQKSKGAKRPKVQSVKGVRVREKMKVESFEDLAAWSKARELVNQIYAITKKEKFCRDRVLVSQIRRPAISVMSNISEGFERQSDKEFARFLYIAKGSCGEVRSQLLAAYDQRYLDEAEFRGVETLARRVSGTIGNLIKYLVTAHPNGSKPGLKRGRVSLPSETTIPSPLEPREITDP